MKDNSWAVIRFKADNPGVWLLHCHIEFHVTSGFQVTIVEAPEILSKNMLHIPEDHIEACKAYPMDYVGNAGGSVNALNLTGANTQVMEPDWGAMYPPGTPAQYS